MKCKTCCYYTIMEPKLNSRYICVRYPPVYMKNEYGRHVTMFPNPAGDYWCGEWKPKDFIKLWPGNLTKEFDEH